MKTKTTYATFLALAAAVLLVLSACGGGGDASAGGSTSSTAPMVSSKTVDGVGPVLVDADGMALYAADQEAGGKVLCTGSCTSIWEPLTVRAGMPTAGDGVDGTLGVTTRPDGGRQVTLDELEFALDDEIPEGVATCQVKLRPSKLSAVPFPVTVPASGSSVKR